MGIIDPEYIVGSFEYVLPYVPVTLGITLAAVVFGTILGILAAVAEVLRLPVLAGLARGYVLVCRSLPNMVLLYLVYYGLPILFLVMHDKTGVHVPYEHVPAIAVAVLGLSLHTGAYLAESFRAAIQSVPKGQVEAALSLGMTWPAIFRRILFPQASVFALPLFANQFLNTMKSTSIVFVITVIELFGAAKLFCEDNSQYFEAYITVALLYWAMGAVFETLFSRLEFRLSRFKRGAAA